MLRIRLLGQFELRRHRRNIELPSRPAKLLLAYLVLSTGTYHPRERLSGMLWPESDTKNALSNLRQALWRLRKTIGKEYLLGDNVSIAFDAASDYWLDTEILAVSDSEDLLATVSVYKGELLPGFYEHWVLLERERLRAVFDRKMQQLLEQLLREENWTQVLQSAEWWIAKGQVPEAAYRALMLSHAAMGELGKVGAAYNRCVEALQQELAVDPSIETQALHDRLLRGEGTSRFLDLHGSKEAASAIQRHNLPIQPTPFIGRAAELAEIKQLLDRTRLLSLTGPGGIGKTRLALQAAADSVEEFTNGVFFVPLAAIDSSDHIVQAVAEALELILSNEDEPHHQVLSYLRRRQLLLVLDNFEHLLKGATIVNEILRVAPEVTVLVTSREKLNLQGEISFTIDGMEFPSLDVAGDVTAYPSISLFLQSARRALPAFEPSTEELKDVTRICHMVQGMPLAIELAAGWLEILSPQEIATELQKGLDILATVMRDIPERHRSIHAVFDHSWSLLDQSDREVFMRLSVFRGGFTREAAEVVAGASLYSLASLVNKSLLRRIPGSNRFEIHELLRQYAQERLKSAPSTDLLSREAHANYFADFMQEGWERLRDSRQIAALEEIENDIENLRNAWRFQVIRGDIKQIDKFIAGFWRVHDIRGWYHAGAELFKDAADALRKWPGLRDDEETEAVYARMLDKQAQFLAQLGYSERGLALAEESVAILRRLNRHEALLYALEALTWNARYIKGARYIRGSIDTTQVAAERNELVKKISDPWLLAYVFAWQGADATDQGDYDEAKQLAEASLSIFEDRGDLITAHWPGLELGHITVALGEYSAAQVNYERVLRVAEITGFRYAAAKALRYLGGVSLNLDEVETAEDYLMRSLRISEALGLERDLVYCLYDIARVAAIKGKAVYAVELLAVVLQHPISNQASTMLIRTGASEVRIRDGATYLLAELEAELPPTIFNAARDRGKAQQLESAVMNILASNSV